VTGAGNQSCIGLGIRKIGVATNGWYWGKKLGVATRSSDLSSY